MDESVSTMEQKQQRPKLNSDDEQEKENQSRISRIYERALDGLGRSVVFWSGNRVCKKIRTRH